MLSSLKSDTKSCHLPDDAVFTKLKFEKSEKTGAIVGFVSQNPKTGRINGVRQESTLPKKICVVDKHLAPDILLNVLYDVAIIPMKDKSGYVVIRACPVEFKATIITNYVKKAIYQVIVKFGNKAIIFDPKDGIQHTRRNLSACSEMLEKRVDIKDKNMVVADFLTTATRLIKRYEADGFIYRAV